MRRYVLLYFTDDIIMTRGIFTDCEKALGRLTILMKDEDDSWRENGYELTKRDDFYELEGDTGYGWMRKWDRKDPEIHLNIYWYLLIQDDDGEEHGHTETA